MINQFINISGGHSFRYHLYVRIGMYDIRQTKCLHRIIYTLKPTGLCILLHTLKYQIQLNRIYGEGNGPCFKF